MTRRHIRNGRSSNRASSARLLSACSVLLAATLGACAAGQGGATGAGGDGATTSGGGGTTTSLSTTSSTASVGGGGAGGGAGGAGGETTGTGGTGGTAGTGGTGGASTSSSAPGGAGGSGGAGGAGGGPIGAGRVVLLAGSGTEMLGGAFAEGAGWTTSDIPSGTTSAPAVALLSPDNGVAVLRPVGSAQPLFSKWNGSTFGAPLGIGMQASAQGEPVVAAGDAVFSVGYWGTDNLHYYAKYAGQMGGWSPVNEAVKPAGGGQSFGSCAPFVSTLPGEVFLAHTGTDGKVYEQRRTAGGWEAATGHDVGGAKTDVTATIATLAGGQEDLLIVYVLAANSQIGWIARKSGASPTWTSGATITDALTMDRVVVAALPDGGAVIAFRGLNSGVYTSIYKPGANPAWSAPAALAALSYTTPSHPAIAPGIGVAQAELAFVDSVTGAVLHARLVNGAWGAPEVVGGADLQFVGMASSAGE